MTNTNTAAARRAAFFVPLLSVLVTAALVIGAASVFAAPAYAQDPAPLDGRVVIPWGDLVAAAFAAGGAVTAWLWRFVPLQWRTNKIFEAAFNWALATTPGVAMGQTVTLDVGNELVERMLEYWIARAPELYKRLGGRAGVQKMAIARVPFDAAVDARALIPPRGGVVTPS